MLSRISSCKRFGLFGKLSEISMACVFTVGLSCVRIPDENGQRSGGKTATIPLGKQPAFRLECGHYSGENGQYKMRV